MHRPQVALYGLTGIPNVEPGDDVSKLILDALARMGLTLQDGDVLVVTQKITSKSEGRFVALDTITPSPEAAQLAEETDKDPRLVDVILRESKGLIRQGERTLIMETHHGWICANAGVDRSNVDRPEEAKALLLPVDPDASARHLREALLEATGADIAVIISDTHGRPWRLGTVNIAIGLAGMYPVNDLRGHRDMFGYRLSVTEVARADELAAAAGLISGQADEALPVVLIRGARYPHGDGRAVTMQRPAEKDLFR